MPSSKSPVSLDSAMLDDKAVAGLATVPCSPTASSRVPFPPVQPPRPAKALDPETRRTEFLPFSRPFIGEEEIAEVVDSLRSGWITTGPKTAAFEAEFARVTGARHAISISSATAGLHLVFLALDLKPGDEVITPSMTFVAAVNMAVMAGATPVFVDVERETLNLDPDLIEEKITERTRAIVPVHYAGLPCDLDRIHQVAKKHGIPVIEDAAHAVGAMHKGRPIGALSDITVFSFHPIKNMTTGEGGMVTTNDDRLAERLKLLRFHGMDRDAWKRYSASGSPHYEVLAPGFKYNMMDIQAALGLHQLRRLPEINRARTTHALLYSKLLADVPEVLCPASAATYPCEHAWHLYVPRLNKERLSIDRDRFMALLKEENIGTGLHFKAVHEHHFYRERFPSNAGRLPVSEWASERILSLPLFPQMDEKDVQDVVAAVRRIVRASRR